MGVGVGGVQIAFDKTFSQHSHLNTLSSAHRFEVYALELPAPPPSFLANGPVAPEPATFLWLVPGQGSACHWGRTQGWFGWAYPSMRWRAPVVQHRDVSKWRGLVPLASPPLLPVTCHMSQVPGPRLCW